MGFHRKRVSNVKTFTNHLLEFFEFPIAISSIQASWQSLWLTWKNWLYLWGLWRKATGQINRKLDQFFGFPAVFLFLLSPKFPSCCYHGVAIPLCCRHLDFHGSPETCADPSRILVDMWLVDPPHVTERAPVWWNLLLRAPFNQITSFELLIIAKLEAFVSFWPPTWIGRISIVLLERCSRILLALWTAQQVDGIHRSR